MQAHPHRLREQAESATPTISTNAGISSAKAKPCAPTCRCITRLYCAELLREEARRALPENEL